MVNSINPTYRPIPPKSVLKRQNESTEVESHTDEKQTIVKPKPLVERRKKGDRRSRNGAASRGSYDMRSSKGRRKEDRGGHPTIEIDV